jgi:hypothetical protein
MLYISPQTPLLSISAPKRSTSAVAAHQEFIRAGRCRIIPGQRLSKLGGPMFDLQVDHYFLFPIWCGLEEGEVLARNIMLFLSRIE